MKEPLKVGVWGVGAWGEKHARVYQGLEGVELVGVHDLDLGLARSVAERHGGRVFERARDLLDACEAVSIATPTIAHREAFEEAAASRRHALVEKPLAPTVRDADAMLAAARAAGVTLQVGQVERFNPAWIAARSTIRDVKFVEAHRLALFQPRSLDIDVVFDLMIHDLDLVLDCLGGTSPKVSAVGVAVLSDNEDIANARLEFEDGGVANLTASRVSQDRLRRIRFFQSDAYLSVDLLEKSAEILRVKPSAGGDRFQPTPQQLAQLAAAGPEALKAMLGPSGLPFERNRLEVAPGEPLTLELAAFARSLRGNGPGAASGEAGRAALAVAEEVREAMKQRSRHWATRSSAVS